MNIAVCDDEENIRCLIKNLIEKQMRDCRIMEFSSGGELLQFWRQEDREQIDILFLDIAMDGTDGMETAEQIREWKEEREEPIWGSLPLLIFVTGHPEYMAKAFSVNAFQYLVKPLAEKEFADVFAQALRECRHLEMKKSMEPRKILVRDGNITRNIPIEDIYYIESSNRKIIIAMGEEKVECYGKIGGMECELGEGFFRTHRGYLVNMKYVERYSRTEVQMKNGSRLLISKYKYQEFVKAYLEYLAENGR
ncbi:MAG: LytTR family DNA-binding domain-containing protein [Lachnospiraceae bacterium]|nr:LytTR family DNA-binding domain-containing protein [Lachnospiraceae bacterium]